MYKFRVAFLTAVLILFWASVSGMDSLPRVLILGDQIYQQVASDLKKELRDKVEIHYPRNEPGFVWNSSSAVVMLDQYLGDEKWDLIHFNCGLGDLIHRMPKINSFRVMPRHAGGIRTTSAKNYKNNLNLLVQKLKATGAKIFWGHTTPIRHSSTNVFEMASEIEYNAIASTIMTRHKVPVNDMYSHVKALINMEKPAGHGADPFSFERKPIHFPLREIIISNLGLKLDQ